MAPREVKKKVQWEPTCELYYFEPPSSHDIKSAWFNESNYRSFRKQNIILSRLAKEIGADTLEYYCEDSYRGIEYVSRGDLYELRSTRRELAYSIVLEDQEAQGEGTQSVSTNWEKISSMYQIISRGALRDAQQIAQQDARWVATSSNHVRIKSHDSLLTCTLPPRKAAPRPCIKKSTAIPLPTATRGCMASVN
jgi:hypothetical protein